MPKFIDFSDRVNLNLLLGALKADTPALWGAFKAQTMIEHLASEMQFTNGTKHGELYISEEAAQTEKQKWVYSDIEIPKLVVVSPPENFLKLRNLDLTSAIFELNKEIDIFERYYQVENRAAIHPSFGALNGAEWIRWHGKHFTHHFKQFGLI